MAPRMNVDIFFEINQQVISLHDILEIDVVTCRMYSDREPSRALRD